MRNPFFGLLRDAEALDGYCVAPLFDHGCGFYSRATTAELEARQIATVNTLAAERGLIVPGW